MLLRQFPQSCFVVTFLFQEIRDMKLRKDMFTPILKAALPPGHVFLECFLSVCALIQPQFSMSISPCTKSPPDETIDELYCWVFWLIQHHFLVIHSTVSPGRVLWKCNKMLNNTDLRFAEFYWHLGMSQIHFVSFIFWLFGESLIILVSITLFGSESPGSCWLSCRGGCSENRN